jgi:5-methylcytosine-specific restriction endonuclease McrA
MMWPVCMCGCMELTPPAVKTHAAKGLRRGVPTNYVAGHYRRAGRQRGPYVEPRDRARRRERWEREWRERTRDHRRRRDAEQKRQRRARVRGAFVEYVDALVVLELHDGVCGLCGGDVDAMRFHVDHVVPLARGGEHSYANTQPACPPCNMSKGARV